jgi:hypothetical protein
MIKIIAMACLCAGALLAQDAPERVTVPLQDASRPPRIHAQLLRGGITVRGADRRDVEIEAKGRGRGEWQESRSERAEGMKRLELPGNAGLDVSQDDNVVTIKTTSWSSPSDLVITVPRHSSLELKCVNDGEIYVEGVDGEIDVNNLNGKITLKNVSGSVLAHSLNGAVLVTMDRIDPAKPMSFSTLNGDIDVTFPENLKANVRMKTDNGEIYSDFDVKLDSGSQLVKNESGDHSGTYHVRFDRTLRGTINGGGPEIQFTTFNGQIFIRKKK